MSLTISSTKTFSGTSGNYSLSQVFTASAKSAASETITASSTENADVFSNNSAGELVFLAVRSVNAGSFQLKDSSNATLGSSVALTAGVSRIFTGSELTGANFYNQGNIASVDFTNSGTTASAVNIDVLYDATP
tara:strand:+ start:244 stop:645 length:402 start_codon:yes stop_codon:yes gene_type:complete